MYTTFFFLFFSIRDDPIPSPPARVSFVFCVSQNPTFKIRFMIMIFTSSAHFPLTKVYQKARCMTRLGSAARRGQIRQRCVSIFHNKSVRDRGIWKKEAAYQIHTSTRVTRTEHTRTHIFLRISREKSVLGGEKSQESPSSSTLFSLLFLLLLSPSPLPLLFISSFLF